MMNRVAPKRAQTRRSTQPICWAVLLSVLAAIAYHNSFTAPFIFDDFRTIRENASIKSFFPEGQFTTGRRRPIGHFSLVFNYQLGGFDVRGYHLVNLLVHLGAGIMLFLLVRHTLRLPKLGDCRTSSANRMAFAVAAIWLVHPLQTESVTYVVQRLEAMAGFFYLTCLYFIARGATASRSWPWYLAAVASSWLGMGTKEVLATAPLVVLLYDRVFLSNSWNEVFRRRWIFYASFLPPLVWLALNLRTIFDPHSGASLGLGVEGITPWQYLCSQPGVILHYLRLSCWPSDLCFDYRWPVASNLTDILVPGSVMVALLLASLFSLYLRPVLGFLGTTFFLVLAPTSSLMPIRDLAVEHRMYLPLASVIVLCVLGFHNLLPLAIHSREVRRKVAAVIFAVVVAGLTCRTIYRNFDYATEIAMWSKVVEQRPDNQRAHFNLAMALRRDGQPAPAEQSFEMALNLPDPNVEIYLAYGKMLLNIERREQARQIFQRGLAIHPNSVRLKHNVASLLVLDGRVERAKQHCREILESQPDFSLAHNQLGLIHFHLGETTRAIRCFERAVDIEPQNASFHFNLAAAYAAGREARRARAEYQKAVELAPDYLDAHVNLGALLQQEGRVELAEQHYRAALKAAPESEAAGLNLGRLLADSGRHEQAATVLRRVTAAHPASATARFELGKVLAQLGQVPEAVRQLAEGLRIEPARAEMHNRLGILLIRQRDFREAAQTFRRALDLDAHNAVTHSNLGNALLRLGRTEQAEVHLQAALRLQPELATAENGLRRLAESRRETDTQQR